MSSDAGATAASFRRVADGFDAVAAAVDAAGAGAWDRPTPCEGWVARDVVRHLVAWVPSFLAHGGATMTAGPSVATDPLAAWRHLRGEVDAFVVDGAAMDRMMDTESLGRRRVGEVVDRFVTGDVLVHTWDLARSADIDVRLDPGAVAEAVAAASGELAEMLRTSGHFGPASAVPDDADDQARLLALMGRVDRVG